MNKVPNSPIKKANSRIVAAIFSVSLAWLAEKSYVVIVPSLLNSFIVVANSQDTHLPISFPELAYIKLLDTTVLSGRIANVDISRMELILQRGSETRAISLNKVSSVQFNQSSPVYRSNGSLIIRSLKKQAKGSEDVPHGAKVILSGIPLSNFHMKKSPPGIAEVNLTGIVPKVQLKGMLSISRKSTYVADELKFNVQQRNMTIVVEPYDR